jgi:glycosyltransferase involved in cell wall biosynthesis
MLLVFGGNLGIPQGLDFLLNVLDECKDRHDIFFLIVGSGTEYPRVDSHIRAGCHTNVRLVGTLPKDQYDVLLSECDVGLVLLDPRFTIPNFPARLTAYMEAATPIIAATDCSTDIRDVLHESGGGIWVHNGDLEGFMEAVDRLSADRELGEEMGRRGRRYLEAHYTVGRAYEIIVAHMRPDKRSESRAPA